MTNNQAIWDAMRVLKTFDIVTLQSVCSAGSGSIHKKTILNYIATLIRAGYVVRSPQGYMLVKRTGKYALRLCKKNSKVVEVLDPNTGEYTSIVKPKKQDLIEQRMKEKSYFTTLDLLPLVKSKSAVKFYIHKAIKEGKIEHYQNIKGYQHKLVEYRYIGE